MTERPTLRDLREEFRGPTLRVILGCIVCQMGLGLTYVKGGLSSELIEGLDLSRSQYAGAATPQLAFQALASPLVGLLTIRLGASRVLAASAVLFAAVFAFYARIDGVAAFYVAAAGVGLAAAGMGDITVGHAITQWVHNRHRGFALGLAYAGSNLGGSLMVLLTGAVAAVHGWRAGLFAVVPVALFVLLPAALFLVREPEGPTTPAEIGESEAEQRHDAASMPLRLALRTRSFWILTATLFSFFFYFAGVLDHLVLFLTDSGLDRQVARATLSQAIGLGIVSKIAGGFLADRMAHERAIVYDYALLAFSSLVLLMLPNPLLLPVFVLSYGFAQAARDVVYPLVIERCFGGRYLAEIYGAMTLTLLPGAALGPLFAAVVRDALGSYRPAFATFAALNLVAVVALLFVRDECTRQTAAPPSSAPG